LSIQLSETDQLKLDGHFGPATQMAMSILVRMGEVYGAPELLDISQAHIDSTIYIGEANLEFAERLAELGAKVVIPTTLNVSGLDEFGWREWSVPMDWASKAHRQMVAYQSMGTIPIWTCAPYQTEHKPVFGEQIAWGESNAIVFANSVIGARTNRYPDLLDACCAITGRAPAYGLHLTENRAGQFLIRLVDVPARIQQDFTFYPVFGHLLGKIAQDRIPVIESMAVSPTEDQLKALGAPAASSGAVALFHIVGVTPEAPTLQAAFQGRTSYEIVEITMDLLRQTRQELTTAEGKDLDMVVLGSPHFSLDEFKQLIPLVDGKQAHSGVEFLITTNRVVAQILEKTGALDIMKRFGCRLTVDSCILATPMLPEKIKTLMTNSGKYAYYAPGLLNKQVVFGSLDDCVRSAIAGQIVIEDSLWSA
jgi:hypothetical protein